MITIYVKRIRSYMHGFLRYRNNKVYKVINGGFKKKRRKNDYFNEVFNENLKLTMSKAITQYNCYQPRVPFC